jgi:hypothetical protein
MKLPNHIYVRQPVRASRVLEGAMRATDQVNTLGASLRMASKYQPCCDGRSTRETSPLGAYMLYSKYSASTVLAQGTDWQCSGASQAQLQGMMNTATCPQLFRPT